MDQVGWGSCPALCPPVATLMLLIQQLQKIGPTRNMDGYAIGQIKPVSPVNGTTGSNAV